MISTIELEIPVLSCLTEKQMVLIKHLTDHCTNLIWVTGGRLLHGGNPEMGVVFGLSRALMLEQPSLRFFPVDVTINAAQDVETVARHVTDVLHQAVHDPVPDFEFVSASGMLHVSRFIPDEFLNRVFREKQSGETMALPLSEAQPCRLDIATVGQTDSVFFRREETLTDVPLPAGFVEVSVKVIGLTARVSHFCSGWDSNLAVYVLNHDVLLRVGPPSHQWPLETERLGIHVSVRRRGGTGRRSGR